MAGKKKKTSAKPSKGLDMPMRKGDMPMMKPMMPNMTMDEKMDMVKKQMKMK